MANEKNVLGTAESTEVFNDYEFSPVPDEKKNTWKSQIFVWLGVGFCLTAFTLGGQIALGLGFWPTVAAVFIGGIILTLVGILCGAIGVRSGLSSTVSSRFTFGKYGAMVFGIIVALCNMGWFGYQCTFFGSSISSVFRMAAGIEVNTKMCIIVGGLLMMVTAIVGYKGIKMLSQIGVPLLFALILFGVGKTFAMVPAAEILSSAPETKMSFATSCFSDGRQLHRRCIHCTGLYKILQNSKGFKHRCNNWIYTWISGYRYLWCNLCMCIQDK